MIPPVWRLSERGTAQNHPMSRIVLGCSDHVWQQSVYEAECSGKFIAIRALTLRTRSRRKPRWYPE